MRFHNALIPTTKEESAQAQVLSHKLMLRSGMVHQLASGVYSSLPLAARILRNITQVVRQHMDAVGAQEVILPMLQPLQLWQTSDRLKQFGPLLFQLHDRKQMPFCLGATHEEVITVLLRDCLRSYRQLPMVMYQIQTKFRDEIRPRFGVMRAREFLMKDAYSFTLTQQETQTIYEKMRQAYKAIFADCGLQTVVVDADCGDMGGNTSQEFHAVAQSGEDVLVFCPECNYAANQDVLPLDGTQQKSPNDELESRVDVPCPACKHPSLKQQRGIEVGHIFDLGTKYSLAFQATLQDAAGQQVPLHMGCYGIGVSRMMAALIEQRGASGCMCWPLQIAPFHVQLISLGNDATVQQAADGLYANLMRAGVQVLYDDRNEQAGVKFNDADLIGCPLRLCLGKRAVQQGQVEFQQGPDFSKSTQIALQQAVEHVTCQINDHQPETAHLK
ncbi:MAG: proline--tRNA ligase [Myxococcota bacterium]